MNIYGTLSVGISGLIAQSNKLGVISDNIANVNTVGYKESVAGFSTLMLNNSAFNYSAQGVAAQNTQRISKQGILQAAQSPTDLAISGNGFFVVSDQALGGQIQYTRAGSFGPDSEGNLRNAAGLFLLAWRLDETGNPIEGALETINIAQLDGIATATNTIAIGANLNADEVVFPGAGVTGNMDPLDLLNANNDAFALIVPNGVNHIRRGDMFNITTGGGLSYDFTYGGFTIGRNVTDPTAAGNGDNGIGLPVSPLGLVDPFQTVGGGSGDVIVTIPSTAGLATGDVVTFSGAADVGGITAAELTGSFVITVLSDTTFRITTAGSDPAVGGTAGGGSTVIAATRLYTGAIFDAISPTDSFFGLTGTSHIAPDALSFTITTAATGTVTFTYTGAAPNPALGQFNNLNNLTTAINQVAGLTARIVDGRLYVGADDGNAAVTFANGQAAATAGSPLQHGVDWVRELGLSNISSSTNRFSTLNNLAGLINASPGLQASISNPLGDASITISLSDPLETFTLSDRPVPDPISLLEDAYTTTAGSNLVTIAATIPNLQPGDIITLSGLAPGIYNGIPDTELNGSFFVQAIGSGTITIAVNVPPASITAGSFGDGIELLQPPTNNGSLLGQLGITPSLNGAPFPTANPVPSTGVLGPAYDPADPTRNMAGGNIAAQFSRTVTVFDNLGEAHNLNIGFIKTAINQWAVEVYAVPASSVTSPSGDGQLASGTLLFNGDGTLNNISPGLSAPLSINWANGADASSITINWGTAGDMFGTPGATVIGLNDGMSQLAGGHSLRFLDQNGSSVGELIGITIDTNGDVIGSYTNSNTQRLYRIPLALFISPDSLMQVSNNVFLETAGSGLPFLTTAGANGAGDIFAARLESSNTDLGAQLTEMIIAQRSYQFNARLISVSDQILQDTTRMGAR